MRKVVLSGYYGFNNLGDEAVLASILNNIRGELGKLDITVLSANPTETEAVFGVRAVKRTAPLRVFKALWGCDVLISGGGSLLQDVTGRLSIFYYLSLMVMGKIMGKKVMVYSQGIGPIRMPLNRWATKVTLDMADAITVREPHSKSDLIAMGLKSERIIITADPVISLEPSENKEIRQWMHDMPGYRQGCPSVGLAFRGKDMAFGAAEKLVEVIHCLTKEMEINFFLIPYYYEQDKMVLDHLELLAKGLVLPVRRHLSVGEMLSLTSELDVLVGTRLHSLIVSAVCGTPMIAVSYDPKIEYFMSTIKKEVFADVRVFQSEGLACEIKACLSKGKALASDVDQEVKNLRKILHRNEDALKQLLQ